jgi:hypothetical protein
MLCHGFALGEGVAQWHEAEHACDDEEYTHKNSNQMIAVNERDLPDGRGML